MKNTEYNGYEAIFRKEDKKRTVLIPWFTDFLSPIIPAVAQLAGYTFVNCPKTSKVSADIGLKYGNNEICYPATLVLGDLIAEIQTGKYRIENLAVAITQTGGQCRATNYISLIKSGLKNAGYGQIPVISVSTGDVHNNEQPGFRLPFHKILYPTLYGFLFGDALGQLLNSYKVREQNSGESEQLFTKYMNDAEQIILKKRPKQLLNLLECAVADFNKIEIYEDKDFKKIGLIGEIFVKYNHFGQAHLTEWLQKQNFEVVVPSMCQFFMQTFINSKVNSQNGISRKGILSKISMPLVYHFLNKKMGEFDFILRKSRFYAPYENIYELAETAKDVLDLSNQFGEGWLIAGEVANFAKKDITRVVCVQPFGCIANHVVAKGIETRLKKLYPKMNLLFLDIDGGIAEVNLQNRLKFLLVD